MTARGISAPAGTAPDLGGGEELKGDRPWHDKMVLTYLGDRVVADGPRRRFETLQPRGLRYLQLTAAGNDAEVVIHRVALIEQVHPHRLRASFACSDPLLGELWRRSWPTLVACSEDVYTDCPWRERTAYGGDTLVSIGVALALSGDTGLARRTLGVRLGFPEPDYLTRITIAPESERLSWASGSVPHPAGPVHVAWRIVGDRLLLDDEAPPEVDVTVAPRGRLAGLTLVLNGGLAAATNVR